MSATNPEQRLEQRLEQRILLISSGTGPVEVREFVAALGRQLAALAIQAGLRLVETVADGDPPRSVRLVLEGADFLALQPLCGTHALIAHSPRRGRASRSRWYAGVSMHNLDQQSEIVLDPRDLEIVAARAGGPGGQNVNKTSSAVRVLHRPTGLAVRASDQRSQGQNRASALSRLTEQLRTADADKRQAAERTRRDTHHALERGNEVARWTTDGAGGLTRMAGR